MYLDCSAGTEGKNYKIILTFPLKSQDEGDFAEEERMDKRVEVLTDIGGKVFAYWNESREGSGWVMRPEAGSELDFYGGAVIIALPPK